MTSVSILRFGLLIVASRRSCNCRIQTLLRKPSERISLKFDEISVVWFVNERSQSTLQLVYCWRWIPSRNLGFGKNALVRDFGRLGLHFSLRRWVIGGRIEKVPARVPKMWVEIGGWDSRNVKIQKADYAWSEGMDKKSSKACRSGDMRRGARTLMMAFPSWACHACILPATLTKHLGVI